MPSWVNSFEKHEIWNALAALRRELDDVRPSAEQPNARDTLEYVAALVATLDAHHTAANALLLPSARLTTTHTQLVALTQAVLTWKSEEDLEEDPESVDAAVVAVIDSMASWPAIRAEQEEDIVNAALTTISQATETALEDLVARERALREGQEKLATGQAALEKAAADLDTANKKKLEELAAAWSAARQDQSEAGDRAVADLRALRAEAQKVVQDSTSLMVGTEYAQQAKARRRTAWVYDGMAVIFGSFGVITLLVYVIEGKANDATVGYAITRLGLAVGAFVIGGFLASRGREQHREAGEMQRTALALSRMAPFVANLDPIAQEVLTVETADRIFTRGELGTVTQRESVLSKLRMERERRRELEEAEETST